tara:strand:- start:789 stop:899 length:111 start_codon:yes stop_codon:yes gene_type:complete
VEVVEDATLLAVVVPVVFIQIWLAQLKVAEELLVHR